MLVSLRWRALIAPKALSRLPARKCCPTRDEVVRCPGVRLVERQGPVRPNRASGSIGAWTLPIRGSESAWLRPPKARLSAQAEEQAIAVIHLPTRPGGGNLNKILQTHSEHLD
jgi:hypothetical protein